LSFCFYLCVFYLPRAAGGRGLLPMLVVVVVVVVVVVIVVIVLRRQAAAPSRGGAAAVGAILGVHLAEREVALRIHAGHPDALACLDTHRLKDASVVGLLWVDERARALLLLVHPAAALLVLPLAGEIELALRHAVSVGVEHLALIDLIRDEASGPLSIGRDHRGGALGQLGGGEACRDGGLLIEDEVAPAGAAALQSVTELLHDAAAERVLRADDARAHAIVVTDVAVNCDDSHLVVGCLLLVVACCLFC